MNSQLDITLEHYEASLKVLDKAGSAIDIEQALAILNARDTVQKALKEEKSIPNSRLHKLIELDEHLRNNAERITRAINSKTLDKLQSWRESVQPSAEAWWWKLDDIAPHPWDSWDWLWVSLSIVCSTANISLLVNIFTRFLDAGVGLLGVAAVTVPSILTLLQAGSQFTNTGKKGFHKLLDKKIPKQYHQEVKFALNLMMTGALAVFWLVLPSKVSNMYNGNGLKNYVERYLGSAERDFLKAISLNIDNFEAHYNLANLYEEWQDVEKAKKEYQLALSGNLPEAYNNLARLYILEKKYSQASLLLKRGLVLAQKNNSNPEIKYSLFKNLGWVRLEQRRYEEAQQILQAAISITNNTEAVKYIQNTGAAHCLLAQVLEKQKKSTAIEQWQKCNQLASNFNYDEENWLYIAQNKIQNKIK
ncbi:tetratricopeptide repeat protein [Fischerella sp. PCC 9605]|uniref:tetratricopeptide repeat protein n=1 Tax=Fischerella sp. PCC 9605 TaxID=1173024 RepID=UPI0004B47DE7|nr:tetratricopeptide repeat protein [Fischerella sp. PCC 9605]